MCIIRHNKNIQKLIKKNIQYLMKKVIYLRYFTFLKV